MPLLDETEGRESCKATNANFCIIENERPWVGRVLLLQCKAVSHKHDGLSEYSYFIYIYIYTRPTKYKNKIYGLVLLFLAVLGLITSDASKHYIHCLLPQKCDPVLLCTWVHSIDLWVDSVNLYHAENSLQLFISAASFKIGCMHLP